MNRRRKILTLIIFAVFSVVSVFLIPKTPAQAFDSTPPTLGEVSASNSNLSESGGTLTLTVTVSSPTYGLAQPPLPDVVINTRPFSCANTMRMPLVSGDDKNGTYKCDLVFTAPLKPGVYDLMIFPLSDKAGNSTGFLTTNVKIVIGDVATPVPTSAPMSTIPAPATAIELLATASMRVSSLLTQVASLNAQLARAVDRTTVLTTQLKRICSAKKKPTGC